MNFLCKLIFTCAVAAEPEVTPRAELTYGTMLYDYYQENYSDALLKVRVAQTQGHTAGAETRFKLAEGSFAFSDQMFEYSKAAFASVDASELTELDNLRLAFHQSREHFRVGDWDNLKSSLKKVDFGASRFGNPHFHPEIEFMRAELALNEGALDAARGHLELLGKNDPYKMYGLYNLGGALRASGDLDQAEATFSQLARFKAKTTETLDLQQRALLAQAFVQREKGEVVKPKKILGNLPANGRYRDLALASFGSLAMESGDYELAARIWLRLQQQPMWTPSTASARLGFPLSLENMERSDLALAQYRNAEQSFSARAVKLDELTKLVEDKQWVRQLLGVFAQGRSSPEKLTEWQEQLGHTDWLEWLSAESVDSLVSQWRELRNTKDWLRTLPADIDSYETLAKEQLRRAIAVKAALAEDGLSSKHRALEAQIDQKLQELEALKARALVPEADLMQALADPEQAERIASIESMYEASESLNAEAKAQWRKRLDRLRGVVFWNIVDTHPVVLQQMRQAIADVEALSASMLAQTNRLQAAEKGLQTELLANFAVYQRRVGDLASRVERALEIREEQLAVELKQGMERESEQVQQYLLTARVAIARTLDQYAVVDEVWP